MRKDIFWAAAAFAVGLVCASQANATDITGSIYFPGGFVGNGYDPSDGGVPPGYGNETSNTVAVGPGVEFGFQDAYNLDTADFSATGIELQDTVNFGASGWTQTFQADTAGYFDGLTLTSSDFSPGITYGVVGDTLTVNWSGEYDTNATYTADFSLPGSAGAAPEPSTWALMIAGLAATGLTFRRTKNSRFKDAFSA